MMKKNPFGLPSISFITACKGRLNHLKETLPLNLFWNKDYPNHNFLLLDYNSEDGLEEWIKSNMYSFIESGKLEYYKTIEPKSFHHSHSRNMLIRLASNQILCNLDADNYTGKDFTFYIAEELKNTDLLRGYPLVNDPDYNFLEDDFGAFGRVATYRNILYRIGGYDEQMKEWAYEDKDLINRIIAMGYSSKKIQKNFLYCISHEDYLRVLNTNKKDSIQYEKTFQEKVLRSELNIKKGKLILNEDEWGCGTVYKNFSEEPIKIEKIKDKHVF